MKKLILTLASVLLCCVVFAAGKPRLVTPDATLKFASRDTCDLFLDLYQPAVGSDSADKPTVIFVFGGGFITGRRDDKSYDVWFKDMTDRGYRIVSIDYRLGLKGAHKVGLAQADLVNKAIHMAVEDAFSATAYLCEHAAEYGIDPARLVISGSSAGAITSLQCEYEICNKTSYTSVLPEGFNYAGVMSFSGAVANMNGPFAFQSEPCPLLMLHGTADRIVNYNQVAFFSTGIFGSNRVVAQLKAKGYDNYWVIRYTDREHEIAASMRYTVDIQESFMKRCIIDGKPVKVDMTVDDAYIPVFKMSNKLDDLYK